jgi:hypothetical protein
VAWYRKDDKMAWARIAGVKYEPDDRNGELKASAPEIAFDFEISAEKSESPASPSSDVVFTQRIGQ